MTARLRRLEVEVSDDRHHFYRSAGQVLLPWDASELQVQHALAVLGVSAPQGRDVLSWRPGDVEDLGLPAALIFAGGHCVVRLWDRTPRQARTRKKRYRTAPAEEKKT